ncbi:hypothetical protein [Spiroplasma endosymbiont of Eupeodes luniger]|uniref:hypothetical protein n=1 Tax=Spiroplasma endosymbiont of Eupeodes luniger TaxID=3066300 RepID=UPI0030D57859
MYTCEKCNKTYQTEAIPHFLETYFCDDCFVNGQREIIQEQIMLMGDNLDQTTLQEKLNEIYSNHNKNALKFLDKNKALIKKAKKITKSKK